MSFPLLFIIGIGIGLLLVLGWVLRGPSNGMGQSPEAGTFEETERNHITYFPQVRQALAKDDYVFLTSKGSTKLARRVRKERRKIALAYLAFLRQDFQKLLRLAKVIAVLSPKVAAGQEFERVRLSVKFSIRYQMIRMKLSLGLSPLPEMGLLSQAVSRLTIQLEAAMRELGERAAQASELASSLERSGLGTA